MEKQRIVHIFGCDFGEEVFDQSQIWETKPSISTKSSPVILEPRVRGRLRVWKNLKTTKRNGNKFTKKCARSLEL